MWICSAVWMELAGPASKWDGHCVWRLWTPQQTEPGVTKRYLDI